MTRLAGDKECSRSAGDADFAEDSGPPRRGNRCPRSGGRTPTVEKSANEPKWGYPLMTLAQRVNIDAFDFANCKRSQFLVVRHEKRPGADSFWPLSTKLPATNCTKRGPRRSESGATAKKRPNEANCCRPLVIELEQVKIEPFGFTHSKRSQFPVVSHRRRPRHAKGSAVRP